MQQINATDCRPLYVQLAEQLQTTILSGQYPPGSKLPPVRELAVSLKVNPNTLQRALNHLEINGILYTVSTTGKFVTQDTEKLMQMREELSRHYADEYISKTAEIGIDKNTAIRLITEKQGG